VNLHPSSFLLCWTAATTVLHKTCAIDECVCVSNQEGVTFIYTVLGRCLFRTGVSSSRADLSSGKYIFHFVFFLCGRLYFWSIIFLLYYFSVGLTSLLGSSNFF
jgi:hypothetical protein